MLTRILRLLTFRADLDDYVALDRRHLAVGLALTWLVGIGRYWDNSRAEALQKAGVGSIVYVFALAALLWLLGLGLKPRRWSYFHALAVLNLERAVFEIMGGLRETTSADASYGVLVLLTLLSLYLFPLLAALYVILAFRRRRQAAGSPDGPED